MRVELTRSLPRTPYLCAACLALRVAQVQATPPPPVQRGRKKARRGA
jgi:hypothetical protein